jgi:hypothetical protein
MNNRYEREREKEKEKRRGEKFVLFLKEEKDKRSVLLHINEWHIV